MGSPPGQTSSATPQDLQDLRVGSPMGPPGPPPARDRRPVADADPRGGEDLALASDRDRERDRRKQDDRLIKRVRDEDGVVDGADHDEDGLRLAREFLNSANNNDLMTNNNNRNNAIDIDLLKAEPGPHHGAAHDTMFQDDMDALTSSPGMDLLGEPGESVVVKCEPLLSARQHSHN